MSVSLAVINPAQTISLDMLQEQPTQTLALALSGGTVNIEREPRSMIDMLLDESGMVIDFMLNDYIVKL